MQGGARPDASSQPAAGAGADLADDTSISAVTSSGPLPPALHPSSPSLPSSAPQEAQDSSPAAAQELKEAQSVIAALQSELQSAREQLAAKDAEIARLTACLAVRPPPSISGELHAMPAHT